MSILTGRLRRHVDISQVSGTGDVAELAEFSDGAVAVRWHGDHPSTACWNDIRDVEIIHGHKGATEIVFDDDARLVKAYARVMPFLLQEGARVLPVVVGPHPDHAGRLRLVFADGDEKAWRFWIALLDGSTDASIQEEVLGEMQHRWTTPDDDLWLQYTAPLPKDDEPTTTAWEMHDDPEMNR